MGVVLWVPWFPFTFFAFIMKSFLPLCLLATLYFEFGEAGLAFKAGLFKGALKGLFKGQSQGKEEERCEVKWEKSGNQFVNNTLKRNVGMSLSSNAKWKNVRSAGQRMYKNVQQRRKECATLSISSNAQLSLRRNVGPRLSKSAPNRKNALMFHLPIHPILLRQKVPPFLLHQNQNLVSSAVLKVRGQSMKMWKFLMKIWKFPMLI